MFEFKIVLIIFFSAAALLLFFSKNNVFFLKAASGFWGGLILQSFVFEFQRIVSFNTLHLICILFGLFLSVYFESRRYFHSIFFMSILCGLSFLPSLSVISAVLFSFFCDVIGFYAYSDSEYITILKAPKEIFINFVVLLPILLILFILTGMKMNSLCQEYFICFFSGGLIYYASSKLAPDEKGGNTLSLIGGLAGFFMGILFY